MGTVYILGAGASCFAGFPLANKLWKFLENEEHSRELRAERDVRRFRTLINEVTSFLEGTTAPTSSPDIELLFTILDLADARRGALGPLNISHGDLRLAKKSFSRLIPSAFLWQSVIARQAIDDGCYYANTAAYDKPEPRCVKRVAETWAKLVQPGDVLVSFNWDPLHEMILWRGQRNGQYLWHYTDGYGFSTTHPSQQRFSQVKILKLHGSSNWGLRNPEATNVELDYTSFLFPEDDNYIGPSGESLFGESLILPSYLKAPAEKPCLVGLWRQAADALQTADEIIVLGYSLPEADGPTRNLLSIALSGNGKIRNSSQKSIQVVCGLESGFGSAYDRWDHFLGALGIRDQAQTVHKTFEQFVLGEGHLPAGK